jgi:hypothetical protein
VLSYALAASCCVVGCPQTRAPMLVPIVRRLLTICTLKGNSIINFSELVSVPVTGYCGSVKLTARIAMLEPSQHKALCRRQTIILSSEHGILGDCCSWSYAWMRSSSEAEIVNAQDGSVSGHLTGSA